MPHFEKMLYDNALLVPVYLEAFQATNEPFYREIAEETLGWVLREMTSPDGPFYSTLDADSEGEEGKFYVWSAAEIERILGEEDAALFNAVYGVEPEGNWEHGHNILHRVKTFAQYARLNGLSESDLRNRLEVCRRKLFDVRSKRIWPGRDEKTLTSWNGLMIGALAQAAQVLDRSDFADAAARAAGFILDRMRTPPSPHGGRGGDCCAPGAPVRSRSSMRISKIIRSCSMVSYRCTRPRFRRAGSRRRWI